MKRITKTASLGLIFTILSLSGLLGGIASASGTATLSLSPASGSVLNGATLSLSVYEDSGSDTVNAVQANLSYPSTQLQFVSISSSSAFGVDAQSTGGSGSVQIGRGTITAVSGNQLVATVYFKALAGSGTADVTFASGSSVVRSTDHAAETLTTNGGEYTLTSPPVTPPSSGGSSSSSSGSSPSKTASGSSTKPAAGGSTPTSTPTPEATVLTISSIDVSKVSGNTATVNWQTSIPASSEVDYGFSAKHGFSAVNPALSTKHSLVLSSEYLKPGQTYHYTVKSVDANGNVATSKDQIFKTTSSVTAKAPAKNSTPWAVIAVAAVVVVLIAAELIRRLIRRRAAAKELDSHIFTPTPPSVSQPPESGTTSGSGTIINPTNPPGGEPPAPTQQ